MMKLLAAALLAGSACALPTVDLGYEIHQASSFNETGRFFNFSNIRYAAPPVNELRFALPQAPAEDRSSVQTGDVGRICPQAGPGWSPLSEQNLASLLLEVPSNITQEYIPPGADQSSPVPPPSPLETEDCLFLDVFVPEQILNRANNSDSGAAVLVWIYGGGYTAGSKYQNPAGLFAASGEVGNGEIIYVSLNYRLGALGFLAGSSYQAEGGVSNLALYDQRFALEWVQENIHLFGGDPDRVTVMGESAGGGSIMHQITAFGGSKGPAPFQRAIPQSPGWLPVLSNTQNEDNYQKFLELTNSSSLEDLRALSSEQVMTANFQQVAYEPPWGSYLYGPVVDGDFAPLSPQQLLAQGRFDKDVEVLVGHNAAEGPYFTPPYIESTESLVQHMHMVYPHIPDASLEHIVDSLYPAVFDGTYPYVDNYTRASLIISESIFTCNTRFLSTALNNETHSYLFSVPPAFHAQDVAYTYYDGGAVSEIPLEVTNSTVAVTLQQLITSFAKDGVPVAEAVAEFNEYGSEANVLELGLSGFGQVPDSNANERCQWWQLMLFS